MTYKTNLRSQNISSLCNVWKCFQIFHAVFITLPFKSQRNFHFPPIIYISIGIRRMNLFLLPCHSFISKTLHLTFPWYRKYISVEKHERLPRPYVKFWIWNLEASVSQAPVCHKPNVSLPRRSWVMIHHRVAVTFSVTGTVQCYWHCSRHSRKNINARQSKTTQIPVVVGFARGKPVLPHVCTTLRSDLLLSAALGHESALIVMLPPY
jgi:hypothetical protein